MKWLFKVLTSRGFLVVFGLVVITTLIGLLGFALGWSLVVTGLVLAVILLVVGLVVLLVQMRATKAASGLEQQIMAQAHAQQLNVRPDQQAEIERLQQNLERAIETLKQSKLGKKGWRPGGGKAALYALPWYLFIGPPGAGKTTAITQSGLNFPVGTDRVRGVGGTRNCDWFFTDQAILLDTAGRYVTEAEDQEEWLAFLETLKKHRKERPINGVLVGIALDELAGASSDEVERHAETIRARIDELIKHLGLRFPVYLLFTKADLLQGFVEFFGEFARKEREAIWGATLDADQQRSPNQRAVFEEEFDALAEALSSFRVKRLRRSMKREDRRLVYNFPLQFAGLKDNLGRFVEGLFQPNPFQETPIFRGFYFSSGTQEGVPIDLVIRSIEAEFGLPPEVPSYDPEVETKSYFIKDVFTDVVVPDRHLARRTSKAATKQRLAAAGASIGVAVALVLFLLGTSQALVRSKLDLNQARDAAAAAATVTWDGRRPSDDELTRVAALGAEIDRLDGGPPLLQLGLNRRGTVLEPARALYRSRVRDFVETYALAALRRELGAAPSIETDPLARQETYDDLKAYLLLTTDVERLGENTEINFLRQYLTDATRTALYGPDSTAVLPAAASQIDDQMAAFVEGLSEGEVAPFQPDDGLVARVRNLIYEQPTIAGVYARIRSEGNATMAPFRLADAVPGRYLGMFNTGGEGAEGLGGPTVPGFFTQRGWSVFAEEAFNAESEDPSRDDWVMGRTSGELPPEMRDPELMKERLHATYFSEYVSAWQQFMRSVRYDPLGDARAAVRTLDDLSNTTDSPLLYLLAAVTDQTTFGELPGGSVGEDVADAARRRVNRAARRLAGRPTDTGLGTTENTHPVTRQFAGLHALGAQQAASGGASPELYQALEGLGQVAGILDEAAADPAQAAEFAATVLDQGGGDFDNALRSVRGGLRRLDADVRRTLFEQPIAVAWGSVLGAAQRHLDDRWRVEVVQPFQSTLAGRYPFDASSEQEAPLGDFERFFRPRDGTIALFYEEALAPFMTRDGRPRSWEGRGLALSNRTENALARAREIGEAVFSGGALQLDFELQAEVPEREGDAPTPSQVFISIHGTDDAYRMGSYRPWVPFSWPGRPGALLSISTQQGDLPAKQYNGDWALFRLLDDATVRRVAQTQYELRWPFRQPGSYALTAQYTLRAKSASAPFGNPAQFFTFDPPPTLD
jgi:type VI secretion system protein ImpL